MSPPDPSSACYGPQLSSAPSSSSSSSRSRSVLHLVVLLLVVLLSVSCLPSSCWAQSSSSSSSAGSSSVVPYSTSSSSVSTAVVNQTTIHIAVCVHGDPSNSSDYFYHPLNYSIPTTQTYLRALSMFGKRLKTAGGVPTYNNNVTVLFQLHYFNIGNTSQTSRANAVGNRIVTGAYGYNFTILLAPVNSTDPIVTYFFGVCEASKSCLAIAPLTITSSDYICTVSATVPPLPPGCSSAGRRRYQYSLSVLYDNNYILESHLSAFRQNGLQNVAILYSMLTYGVQAAQVTSDTVLGLGMNLMMDTMMSNVTWSAAQVAAYVGQLQSLKVEVICIPSTAGDTNAINTVLAIIHYFKAIDWLPSAIVFAGAISVQVQAALSQGDYAYMFYAAQWDWHLKGSAYQTTNTPGVNLELFPATSTLASPAVFRQAMFSDYNTTLADSLLAYAADGQAALNMVQKLIELAGAYDVESLRAASKSISVPTVTGTLQMDPYGRPVVDDPVAYQVLPNASNIIIAPYSISVNPILPMPQFWERTFQPQYLSQPIEKAAVAFTAVSMAFTLALIVLFIVYRSHPVMKASTPLFCVLMALGGLLMQSSVYATGLYVTTACCQAQVWLLTVGFSMLFGALFMKTYRVWRIFNAGKKLMKVAITNRQLLIALALLLSFDVILNIVWSAMGAFSAVYVSVDTYRPYYDYQQCDTSSSKSLSILYLTLIEKAVLVFGSVVLTFATRNVPSKFNETPYLASAIYNCALMLCFIVPIIATGIGGREVSYAVRVFGIQALVLVTLSIVFLPKFYLMWGVEERRLKEMEKLNPHGGDTNTDSGHHSLKNNKPAGSKLNTSSEQTGSTLGNGKDSPHGSSSPANARVYPVSARAPADSKDSRTSISTESGKFLQPPNNTGKDSPHSVTSGGRSLTAPTNPNRFARPQMTSNAFVKAEPLPGQLDGHGGQQSDIQPLMANETGEDVRHPSSSASGAAGDQQRRGSIEDEADLRVDENDSVSSLVSKSLRLTQRLTQFQSALETVNKELDKRKKSKSPMHATPHSLADTTTSSHSSTGSSNTDSPLESER